jgi:hypothetical protein
MTRRPDVELDVNLDLERDRPAAPFAHLAHLVRLAGRAATSSSGRVRAVGRAVGVAVALAVWPSPALAKEPPSLLPGAPVAPALSETGPFGFYDLWIPWIGFLDGWRALDLVIVFLLAAALGAVIAYHPRTREKASTLPELEQPKTFIMYALVGAVIARIVEANPAMALVIFGIGGLMRFRTDVGPAKDTGRVILTAVVGVCCGLKLMVVAVTATGLGWILLWLLERETFTRMVVKGLAHELVVPSADAYRRVLLQSGCRIFGERKKFIEGQVSFVFAAPDPFDRERFEERLAMAIPDPLRGALDWDMA